MSQSRRPHLTSERVRVADRGSCGQSRGHAGAGPVQRVEGQGAAPPQEPGRAGLQRRLTGGTCSQGSTWERAHPQQGRLSSGDSVSCHLAPGRPGKGTRDWADGAGEWALVQTTLGARWRCRGPQTQLSSLCCAVASQRGADATVLKRVSFTVEDAQLRKSLGAWKPRSCEKGPLGWLRSV